MGTEETLQGFKPEAFVPVLSNILDMEHQPQQV